jgi:methylmalonyl-CoA mutase N-terminal domain/subunit
MSPDGSMTGGILRGIEDGWFMGEIADSAFAYQRALEKGEKKVVGVNVNTDTIEEPLEILRISHEVERAQVAELTRRRAVRDGAAVEATLARLGAAARTEENLVPLILDAVRAEATLGEVCGALREVFGEYREPARF